MHDIYQKALQERKESIKETPKEQPLLLSVSQRDLNEFSYLGTSASINNELNSLPNETLLSGKNLI